MKSQHAELICILCWIFLLYITIYNYNCSLSKIYSHYTNVPVTYTHDLPDPPRSTKLSMVWCFQVDFIGVSLESRATAMDTPALLDTASWMAAAAKPFGNTTLTKSEGIWGYWLCPDEGYLRYRWQCSGINITHRIHVCYIYLHLQSFTIEKTQLNVQCNIM